MTPGDSGSSTLRALGIGCLVVLVLGGIGTIVGAVLVVRGWRSIPTLESSPTDAAPVSTPPLEVTSWPEGDAGVIVDVCGTSLTAMHAPAAGVYLVSPDGGTYSRWTGASAACSGTSQCGSWAGSRDRVFASERAGRILGIDAQAVVTPVDLEALQAPTVDANVPISASWDGQTVAYSSFGDNREVTVVIDLAHGKVLQPRLDGLAPSRSMALSPNGARLAYATASGLSFVALVGARLPAVAVVPWHGAVRSLAWAPDGSHLMAIAEASPPQNARELWVIDATTRAARRIALPAPRKDPEGDLYQRVVAATFAPDGRHLLVLSDIDAMCVHPRTPTACVCDAALYQVGVDGSGWRRLGPTFQGCGDVLWIR
jgi:hypothetical protein